MNNQDDLNNSHGIEKAESYIQDYSDKFHDFNLSEKRAGNKLK